MIVVTLGCSLTKTIICSSSKQNVEHGVGLADVGDIGSSGEDI